MADHRSKPVLGAPPPPRAKSPIFGKAPQSKNWTFTFRYWQQIEYFGLNKSDSKWFVSLLEKLADLSRESIDYFMSDGSKKDYWRYHDISWTQRNIPVQRYDLNWLPVEYLNNEAEYPLVQFQISLALGRVVGFWDEAQVFNIVLLDPLHNIQPAERFDYRVDPCSPLPCQYTCLLEDIDRVRKNECIQPECPVSRALQGVPGKDHSYTVSVLRIDDDIYQEALRLIEQGRVGSLQEIVMTGVLKISDQADNQQS